QCQADSADLSVVRPRVVETTALGAAMLTGRAVGLWDDRALEQIWQSSATFTPSMPAAQRERMLTGWQRAVSRAKGWVEEG
ncbi:MAG: glycerol kinase, partial [Eubacteriales bacterium]|nr:glycerol kinase [Eubacteriales bacterium]